jgi:hypothetical protein
MGWGRRVGLLVSVAFVAVPTVAQAVPTQSAPAGQELVFNGEADRLNVYDAATGEKRTLIENDEGDPGRGLDINAEICFVPDGVPWKPAGEIWFIAGEDTEQNSEPGVIKQGWGLFRLTGTTLATLQATEVGKLVPDSFVTTENSNPENYGCGVLPDGRIVTGDVGDQLPHEPATGQLIVWFPTAAHMQGSTGPDRNDFARVPHCKIDVAIGTAGGIEVDGTDVYIASNRPAVETAQPGGVYRYDSTVWPTGETAAQGCGRTDSTGEQLADADKAGKELFIPQTPGILTTPSDIVDSGRGTFFVSSVFTGQIAEFGRDGVFRRFVMNTTGQLGGITPFGIGVTSDGTLWVADIGIIGPGPAEDEGSVVRIEFDAQDNPGQPEFIDEELQFPDGIGVVVLPGAPAPSGASGASGPTPASAPPATRVDLTPPSATGSGELARTGVAVPFGLALLGIAVALGTRRVARA